jgi:hypothetical protein
MRRAERAVNCAFSFVANQPIQNYFRGTAACTGTFIATAVFLHRARV